MANDHQPSNLSPGQRAFLEGVLKDLTESNIPNNEQLINLINETLSGKKTPTDVIDTGGKG